MEEKTTKNWEVTDERFVAFFDILGFKDMIMRNNHSNIYDKLINIAKSRKGLEILNINPELKPNDDLIKTVSFSDSIVIFSKDNTKESFITICTASMRLLADTIKLGIMMKGSIAFGEVSLNQAQQIYFGQPIIDAYLLEEELNYLGIVLHNTVDEYILKHNIDHSKSIIDLSTPLKTGVLKHNNLLWFRFLDEIYKTPDLEKRIEIVNSHLINLRLTCTGSPRRYIDNTERVLKEIIENHQTKFTS